MDKKSQPRAPLPWFEVSFPTHAERVDLVTAALATLGITGSEVREPRPGAAEIVVYLEAENEVAASARARQIATSLPGIAAADVEVGAAVSSTVWTENWRQHFAPIRVGRNFTIVAPWERNEHADRVIIVINPGAAFGTGQHETTELCLEALEDVVSRGDRVADIGCGSGILAIAAAKLGAAHVLAIDVDPAAIEATRENVEANGVSAVVEAALHAGPPEGVGYYDVVTANIYSDTLCALAERLTRLLRAGGTLVLSGIDTERSAMVATVFAACGLRQLSSLARGEWAALVFERP